MRTRKIAETALLTAVALIIYVVEAQLPSLTNIPGIKLGLSNVVTLFAMYTVGVGQALLVMVARVTLGSLATGQVMGMIFSLAGGALSFFVCILLKRLLPVRLMWVVSAFGAIGHNIGQIAAAVVVTGTREVIYYLPILVVSGALTGVFTGAAAQLVLRRVKPAVVKKLSNKSEENGPK